MYIEREHEATMSTGITQRSSCDRFISLKRSLVEKKLCFRLLTFKLVKEADENGGKTKQDKKYSRPPESRGIVVAEGGRARRKEEKAASSEDQTMLLCLAQLSERGENRADVTKKPSRTKKKQLEGFVSILVSEGV